MFLQDKVYEFNEKFKKLKNIKNIVIWGAGVHTNQLFEKTDLLSYHIESIVDIDENKQGTLYFGFIVKNPEKESWNKIGGVVISVPGKEKQIAEVLTEKFNFKGRIISLYKNNECTPFYLLYNKMTSSVRYLGDYDSWSNAKEECDGYEDTVIINKVINATKKVIDGSAAWERDGCLFYEKKYTYKICSAILRCALQNHNQGVRILDIGGSLGSTYFQNREYLKDVKNLKYIIAEQNNFADYGHKNLENCVLKFVNSAEKYEENDRFDIILMSGSLQYIFPYKEIVSKIVKAKPRYIILDRILVSNRVRICKETVPKEIYKSSYPVIIYSEEEIMNFFKPEYKVIEKDISSVPEVAYFVDGKAESRYYVFQRIQKNIFDVNEG